MSRNALYLLDAIDTLVSDGQSCEIGNVERERAAMQMRRERRRRKPDQPAARPADLLAEREPGANASPRHRGIPCP